MFDWDIRCRLADNLLVQFEAGTSAAVISASGTLELYDRSLRVMPGWVEDLNPEVPGNWDLGRHVGFRLSARQHQALMLFLKPATPRAVLRKLAPRWQRRELEAFLGVLIYRRMLTSEHLAPVPRGVALRSERRRGMRGQGLVIIGVGARYLRMACALAQTVRVGSPALPIALVHCGEDGSLERLPPSDRLLFNHFKPIRRSDFSVEGVFSPFLLKLHLDDLTPFRKTLFMDADSAVFSHVDLERELQRYAGFEFASACSGTFELKFEEAPLLFGINISSLREFLKLRYPVARINSNYLYFEKTAAVREFFHAARSLHSQARTLGFPSYRGVFPDEPFFAAASGLVPLRMFAGCYRPLATRTCVDGEMNLKVLGVRFLGLTLVVDPEPDAFVGAYNEVVAGAARHLGNPSPYVWEGLKPL